MAKRIHPVILCGGAGTRLWPAYSDSRTKQFLKLIGPLSTLQETIKRVSDPAVFAKPVIITNYDYRFLVREQLEDIGADARIVLHFAGISGSIVAVKRWTIGFSEQPRQAPSPLETAR